MLVLIVVSRGWADQVPEEKGCEYVLKTDLARVADELASVNHSSSRNKIFPSTDFKGTHGAFGT
jgi:hypothetical protein